MRPFLVKFFGIALLLTSAAYAQSLGDVARENREKKAAGDNSTATPKVITNKDLPKNVDADQPASEEESQSKVEEDANAANQRRAELRATHRSLQQQAAEQRIANQWKRQILAQKDRVAALQARVDELNAQIRATYGNVQYEPPYSGSQARQLRRVSQTRQQLDVQRMRLADMQESARRAGMHTPVYDP